MSRARPVALLVPLAALTVTLGACTGANSAYCRTLVDEIDVATVVFHPAVPTMVTPEDIDTRLALLEKVEDDVPADLEDELETWMRFLEEVKPLLDSEDSDAPARAFELAEEAEASRDALFEHYSGTCLD